MEEGLEAERLSDWRHAFQLASFLFHYMDKLQCASFHRRFMVLCNFFKSLSALCNLKEQPANDGYRSMIMHGEDTFFEILAEF